jgi:hypothetical protein
MIERRAMRKKVNLAEKLAASASASPRRSWIS